MATNSTPSQSSQRSGWTSAASSGASLSAAVALIRMSDQRRAIATIYAVFAGVVALGPAVPVLATLGHHLSLRAGIQLLPSVVQLVMPVSALLLVHRAVIPAARARFRSRGGLPTPPATMPSGRCPRPGKFPESM